MRLPRKHLLALLALIPVLIFAGCGGGEVAADEVPGDPVTLTPASDDQLGSGGGDEADENQDQSADDTADDQSSTDTAPDDTGTVPETTAPPADDTSGGATEPSTTVPEDTATDEPVPETGSEFCDQNPGAC